MIIPALDGTAACTVKGDPDWWFPAAGENLVAAKAKRVCATCPVRDQCLSWAINTNERGGIWGGLGEADRDKIRIKRFGNGHQARSARAAERRAEVLRLTREGQSSKQIADRLGMSETTITAHRASARKAGEL